MNRVNESVPRHAATLMLIRDAKSGPEVYMLKRPGRGVFPDLHVFPGGKVDEQDHHFNGLCGSLDDTRAGDILSLDSNGLSYWVAVIRECFEECGIILAERDGQEFEYRNPAEVHAYDGARHAISDGKLSLKAFVEEQDLTLATSRVHYFSHWITPTSAPARFNTRFFIAELPKNQDAIAHSTELESGTWINPKKALRYFARDEWQMIVPTLTSLRMISSYENVASLLRTVRVGMHKIPVQPLLHAQGMQYDPKRW